MDKGFHITQIQSLEQPELSGVIDLWSASRKTLGYFPRGAFEDHAEKGTIFAARDVDDNILGYILYRTSKGITTIVHLCIANNCRKHGLASALFQAVKNATFNECEGVALRCRRDYPANNFWPKLGFTALDEFAGKSQEGHLLVFWWYDYCKPNLFSKLSNIDNRTPVVIDANVFFDLESAQEPNRDESLAITADWLSEFIDIYITPELFNEIHRQKDDKMRGSRRRAANKYKQIPYDHNKFFEALSTITTYYKNTNTSDESDIKHLAITAASEADIFYHKRLWYPG